MSSVTNQVIVKEVKELQIKLIRFKDEVFDFFELAYIEHQSNPYKKVLYDERASEFEVEIKNIEQKFESQLKDSTSEMQKCSNCLKFCSNRILLITKFSQLHNQLIVIENLFRKKKYKDSMITLLNLENQIVDFIDEEFNELIEELKLFFISKKTNLVLKFGEIFFDTTILEYNKVTIMRIDKSHKELHDILKQLYTEFISTGILHNFANNILKRLLEPLLKSSMQVCVSEDDKFHLIKMVNAENSSDYSPVFSNILIILKFLEDHFGTPELNEQLTVFKYITEYIGHDVRRIINQYFKEKLIPDISKGLLKISEVLRDTEKFENELAVYILNPDEKCKFVNFITNFQIIFNQQMCQECSRTVRELIQNDIIVTVNVQLMFESQKYYCLISKSALDLVCYLQKTLLQTNSTNRSQLVKVVKNAVSVYSTMMTEYHKEVLSVFPKAVAIFHNNCFFMSEKLAGVMDNQESKQLKYQGTLLFR